MTSEILIAGIGGWILSFIFCLNIEKFLMKRKLLWHKGMGDPN